MASHLQATAGSISRAQQKTLPTAHVNSTVHDFAQSVASNMNATNVATTMPGCGKLAAAQPAGSTLHALLREEQQPGIPLDVDSQHSSSARTASSCQACSSSDAATERVRSWYGQRVWTRAASAQLPPGVPQAATHEAGASGEAGVADTANAPPQSQAWKFSVMCYNILADTYAQYFAPKLYRDVPRPCLDWQHRLGLLLEEIRHWGPDVVCLQEVQHYDDLEPEMRAAGYEGRFMRRTGRRRDGCATFWRADRLRACSIQRLDFAPLGLEDNVAMLLSLAPRCEGAAGAGGGGGGGLDSQTAEALSSVRLLVATTHITFDPAKGDVKLGQVRTLLNRAASLAADPPPEEPPLHPHSHRHPHHHHHHPSPSPSNCQACHQLQDHPRNHTQTQTGEQQRLPYPQQHQQHRYPHSQSQDYLQYDCPDEAPGGSEGGAMAAGGAGTMSLSSSPSLSSSAPAAAAAAVEGRWRKPAIATRVGGSPVEVAGAAPATAAAGAGREHQGQQQQGQEGEQEALTSQQQQQRRQPLQTLAIITGDFNSTAGSPLYQFVARGSLDLARTNRKKLSGQLHGVCHTQYKPVSEVKQLHAQRTTAAAAAPLVAAGSDTAAAAATAGAGGVEAADAPAVVTAVVASPPGTPPSTPSVALAVAAAAAAAADAGPAAFGSGIQTPARVSQRLTSAAMDSAAGAISSCTAKAVAAASQPSLASPAARAAAAVKVLDAFLSSAAAAASCLHRGGAERWSEKELRSAMGEQYDAAVVQTTSGCRALPNSLSLPALAGGALGSAACGSAGGGGSAAADSSSQLQQHRMGRQHNPPAVNRLSFSGGGGGSAAAGAAAPSGGAGRRSLDIDRAGGSAASVAGAAAVVAPPVSPPVGSLVVQHPLRLKSSYVEVARGEPAFTSIHSGFMGTVDFIWYTTDSIQEQQQQVVTGGGQAEVATAQVSDPLAPLAAVSAAASPVPAPSADTGRVAIEAAEAVAAAILCECHAAVEGGPPPQPQSGSSALHETCSAAVATAAAGTSTAPPSDGDGGVGRSSRRFQLVPVAVLQPPDLELLPRGLPAQGWGSDHVCVMTQFELRPV